MDTTKLIEEAERWARNVSESPGNGTAGEDLYGAKLLCDLAAALKASEERAEKAEELAAANLAANKRIVELEHERDAALLAAQGARRTAFNAEQKAKALDAVQRDTIARLEAQVKELRAELARLTTPRPIADAPRDGTNILGVWLTSSAPEVMHWDGSYWTDEGEELVYKPTHYLPLPEVKP